MTIHDDGGQGDGCFYLGGNPHMREASSPQLAPSRPLTEAMDNVLAWRLGKICLEAASSDQKVGDYIDRGLILRRLLDEGGFHLVAKEPRP